MRERRRHGWTALALVAAAFLALSSASAAAPLEGSLIDRMSFPARAIVVWDASGHRLDAGGVSVSENGGGVSGLTVTPLASPAPGDFGVVLALDTSVRMGGAPILAEMQAARALAAQRAANQQLGILTFDSAASVMLPLGADQPSIQAAVQRSPWIAPGSRVLPAVSLALSQLTGAQLPAGAVIVLADGQDAASDGALSDASLASAAHQAGIRIFTVGIRTRYSTSQSLRRLSALSGGAYTESTPAQLPRTVASILSSLDRGYLIRYRSLQPRGHNVTVAVRIAGLPSLAAAGYASPSAAPAPPAAPAPSAPRPAAAKPPAPKPPAAKPAAAPHPAPAPGAPAPRQSAHRRSHLPTVIPAGNASAASRSFWHSARSPIVIAIGCALLLTAAFALLLVPRSKRGVQRRVENFIHTEPTAADPLGGGEPEPRGGLEKALRRRSWWPEFVESVHVARIRRSPAQLVKLAIVCALAVGAIATVLLGSVLVMFPVLILAPFVLNAVVRRAAKRQRTKFCDQLPAHLQDLSGAMRAGRSIVGALASVAEASDEPMKSEFERAIADERLGLPLEETLEAIAKRMDSEDFEQVALVAALHRRSGSNVAEALDRVAEGARERADLRREMAALTGQARISSWVLTGLSPVLLVAMSLVNPKYVKPLFHTVAGIFVLGFCALLVFIGRLVMNKIINVQV